MLRLLDRIVDSGKSVNEGAPAGFATQRSTLTGEDLTVYVGA